MDVFFYSFVIVGILLFIKVIIIIIVYLCRARRRRALAEQLRANRNDNDSALYPSNPYNQQSPFVNFEEIPQPVITVTPGEQPQTLLPEMRPPPYSLAESAHHKPPAYDEIYKTFPGTSVTTAANDIDAGHECVVPPVFTIAQSVSVRGESQMGNVSGTTELSVDTQNTDTGSEQTEPHARVSPGGGIVIV